MRVLALLVVLLTVLAGCSGKGHDAATPPPATASTTLAPVGTEVGAPLPVATFNGPRITLEGCTNFGGVFPVPADAAQALLPDGFKPVPAGDPQGGVQLYVLALSCEKAGLDGKDLGEALLAYEELPVTPDAAHQVANVTDYTVPLLFAAQPKELGDALAGYHLGNAGSGDLSWSNTLAGTFAAQGTRGADGFTLTGDAPPALGTPLESGDFVLFGVQDRHVAAVVHGHSQGGLAQTAAAALQGQGSAPLLAQARPATKGFSVAGFSLAFEAP